MSLSIAECAEKVREAINLPPGYCIVVDNNTDTIIVAHGSEADVLNNMNSGSSVGSDGSPLWGFALPRSLIDDNLYIDQARAVFPQLVRVVENTAYVKSINKIEKW